MRNACFFFCCLRSFRRFSRFFPARPEIWHRFGIVTTFWCKRGLPLVLMPLPYSAFRCFHCAGKRRTPLAAAWGRLGHSVRRLEPGLCLAGAVAGGVPGCVGRVRVPADARVSKAECSPGIRSCPPSVLRAPRGEPQESHFFPRKSTWGSHGKSWVGVPGVGTRGKTRRTWRDSLSCWPVTKEEKRGSLLSR